MQVLAAVPLLSLAVMVAACNSAPPVTEEEDTAPEGLAQIEGTWTADRVAVSGHGHYDGTSTLTYNADGTYLSDANFTDADTGCVASLVHTGTYTGDGSTLQVQPTGGEVEVTSCTDETSNIARRAHAEDELAQARSSIAWNVTDGTLTLDTGDGLERTYNR